MTSHKVPLVPVLLISVLSLVLLLTSCARSSPDSSPAARVAHYETGRCFLKAKKTEACGYGLYSYLLLGSAPNDSNRERYQRTVAAFLRFVPDIKDLESTQLPLRSLNVAYIPLVEDPYPLDIELVQAKGNSPRIGELADWVLLNYDYARARALLNAVPGGPHSSGPYFVSTMKPLSEVSSISEHYLYQDLSTVPPAVIEAWVREFINQAGQERFWESRNVAQLALTLRKSLAEFTQASSEARRAWPRAKKELEKLISYKK